MKENTITALAAVDASANQNSIAFDARQIMNVSAIAIPTGSSTGTLNIQGSNDPDAICTTATSGPNAGQLVPVNWVTIPTIGTVTIAAATLEIIPAFAFCYRWIRVNYVKNNGSAGTITVYLQTQGAN